MREKTSFRLMVAEMLLQILKRLSFRQSCIVLFNYKYFGPETAVEILLQEFKKRGFKQSCKALLLARKYHLDQFRKGGEPYIWHPIRMALLALWFPGITDDIVATILLHDVIED